jgi:hypothetical protein
MKVPVRSGICTRRNTPDPHIVPLLVSIDKKLLDLFDKKMHKYKLSKSKIGKMIFSPR